VLDSCSYFCCLPRSCAGPRRTSCCEDVASGVEPLLRPECLKRDLRPFISDRRSRDALQVVGDRCGKKKVQWVLSSEPEMGSGTGVPVLSSFLQPRRMRQDGQEYCSDHRPIWKAQLASPWRESQTLCSTDVLPHELSEGILRGPY
jgi:hypothetical protein